MLSLYPSKPLSPVDTLLLSGTHVQMDVTGWRWFSATQGANMSHARKKGWRCLPSSRIATLSCMWWCTKWIRRLVHVVGGPLQSPTGYLKDPAALGNYCPIYPGVRWG